MPIRKKTDTPAQELTPINFGALKDYTGGFVLPEGRYALEFFAAMEKQREGSKFQPRLGVLILAYPLSGGEAIEQFLSLGGKAASSFAPNPDTQKGFVAIPGGVGGTLNNKSNWFLFLNSLYDAGMPEGTLVNDFEAIDGIHVHTGLMEEPDDRKGFGAKTGEAAQEEKRLPGKVPVVVEILESGRPWEGTGGVPDGSTPVVTAPKAAPKALAGTRAPLKAVAAPVAALAAEPGGDDDQGVILAAANGMATILEKLKKGQTMSHLQLRASTFKAVKEAAGDEMAQAVQSVIFSTVEQVNTVLGELGYVSTNGVVKEV